MSRKVDMCNDYLHKIFYTPTNDLNEFLLQSQIIFDGNAVNLSDKDRNILEMSLRIALLAIEKEKESGNNGNEESH